MTFDISSVRQQFPSLNDAAYVYLDSAATTQKPQCVIDRLSHYYQYQNANVHRGSHHLTAEATQAFEQARSLVANFIGAASEQEIIWTRGATESLNLIAQSWGRANLSAGDEILVSETEHHANIVPWQLVAEQTGARVVKIPMTAQGEFGWEAYTQLLNAKTKLVAVAHMTNVTGTRLPLEAIIPLAHQTGAVVVVDGAQGIVHESVNMIEMDADFYVFSGHKLYAPTGIGVLYGKQHLLDAMPPWQGGGKMVEKVSFEQTTFTGLPGKFEAGTPNIAGAITLAEAIRWYQSVAVEDREQHLHQLQQLAYQGLSQYEDVRVIGYQPNASILSFVVEGVHHQDVATLLDQQGIIVRSGHHCAHPCMDAFGIQGTIRLSFGIYNTMADVQKFIAALDKSLSFF
ncbi:cysteine desulfurase CsdA [Vibrio gazogenes]|uniref:Probable cysteine desulfurase n=1 Tax=Vibrio gazogenes DSM 21264 = NBRC 103151 TaxID=1123492 RepID=A0A1M4WXZ8_VIBGA|nr:cysteine desulfurase CsdA [Vibrio gazogenes]USP13090.1 cysteine desulfurase CsdA [Vibrio gazogenes]SHE85943.1 cysteine desulfurase [Vibrio gazogenes DSM 21264] [Vibrio gazogenes DSM 21264 = NBRC 103151]SJN53484.1 putative cysteine desulfurase [Vibrio gazogenes]